MFGSGDILQLKDTIESPLHHVRWQLPTFHQEKFLQQQLAGEVF